MKQPEGNPENLEGNGRDTCQLYFNENSLKIIVNTKFHKKKGVAAVHLASSFIRTGYLSKNLTNSRLSFIFFDC